jgi:type III restriction enzyme
VNEALTNPILNGPYDPPESYFEIGLNGPTGKIIPGRRPSESFIPIPQTKKGHQETLELDFDATGERREANQLINDIRRDVEIWRSRNYAGVTPISRKLLQHWADRGREDRVLYCQREAAETAIFLAEVSGRHGFHDYRSRLDDFNQLHNLGLPRVGLKMATGAGKTVVMAMLIAWQTANKVHAPNDARFAKRFLVVTPGITIRDRLRVILPNEETNYYRERDLVPPDLGPAVAEAQIVITNYHAFLLKDSKEIQGVAANTRKILLRDTKVDPFRETPDAMVTRVLRDFTTTGKGREIVVINDEAHHCYRNAVLDGGPEDLAAEDRTEAKQRNEDARVWFRGLQAIKRKVGIKAIYDLSATPFYLKGSGYNEGYIFPWVVSDFSLMDAIESGIVKVPRIPVDDDATGDLVTYLRLWDYVGDKLPKKRSAKAEPNAIPLLPDTLEGALYSLYRSYERAFDRYTTTLEAEGEPPPVFIVVCPNTVVSKMVYDWVAGNEVEAPDGSTRLRPGELALLSNIDGGEWLRRPRTVLIDSEQLERGESLKDDFKKAAGAEIDSFRRERQFRGKHDEITDEDLLREVMNTVGKKGKLGEAVRCVVSVAMLTEGWDANTVTHILGIRRFGSQLLCEQVVGRGLRRRSYAVNADGRFEPEYAEVYGVPFAFIPGERPTTDPKPKPPATEVRAVADRYDLRITFPKLDGYRIELPDEQLHVDWESLTPFHVDRDEIAFWVEVAGIVGTTEEHNLDRFRHARPQEVAYGIARNLVLRQLAVHDGATRPWLFPRVVDITKTWLGAHVSYGPDAFPGLLMLSEAGNRAAEHIFGAIVTAPEARTEILQPMIRRFDPEGSTDDVYFVTRKVTIAATKSPMNQVVLDGPKGNTWEERLAGLLERHPSVAAFVKNDHLGFTIPYVHAGHSYSYLPDFLVRLVEQAGDATRTLIVEVSGGQKGAHSPGTVAAKADTARNQWCTAVNNDGRWGRWGYVEIKTIDSAEDLLNDAIEALYADEPVIGEPVA